MTADDHRLTDREQRVADVELLIEAARCPACAWADRTDVDPPPEAHPEACQSAALIARDDPDRWHAAFDILRKLLDKLLDQ